MTNRKPFIILTGSSQGIGEALCRALLARGCSVQGLSRKKNSSLAAFASSTPGVLHQHEFDLNNGASLTPLFENILDTAEKAEASELALINNAAVLNPIKPVGKNESLADLSANLQVNLTAPLLLCELFVKRFQEMPLPKKILNISSGAAQHPIAGWSLYCTAKAGLRMFSETLALEQAERQHPFLCVSFAPGVVETNMQATIRQSHQNDCPSVQHFIEMKEKGQLRSPDSVAEKLATHLFSRDFGLEHEVNIKDLI